MRASGTGGEEVVPSNQRGPWRRFGVLAIQDHQQAQVRAGRQFVGQLDEPLRRRHQHTHGAIAQDVPDLGRLQQGVDRHEHGARQRCAEDRRDGLDPLGQVDGHALLPLEAGGNQPVCEAGGEHSQLRIRGLDAAVLYGTEFRIALGAGGQQVMNQDRHSLSVPLVQRRSSLKDKA